MWLNTACLPVQHSEGEKERRRGGEEERRSDGQSTGDAGHD